ncbi:hypothetical protein ebA6109 [Aromatoleum aromaticum EbN1]|uniref:Uncharacterized protein n=1 Tax=Aromatoleum aromaticum (strain DSM 19018 / LMG 30748 / EbN1) TaxID=76114 RepID=Q5NZ99_AROAE|nr:hypothetical protein ebA6109 [Aromatoleum aromaticum EbN1]
MPNRRSVRPERAGPQRRRNRRGRHADRPRNGQSRARHSQSVFRNPYRRTCRGRRSDRRRRSHRDDRSRLNRLGNSSQLSFGPRHEPAARPEG